MDLKVTISQKAAEWLEQRAKAAGIDEAQIAALVLQEVAEKELGSDGILAANGVVGSGDDLDSLLNEFFAQNPAKLPSLPDDFSRGDLYTDHD